MKFVKFILRKDIKNNRIIVIPEYYNPANPFHGRTFIIDYSRKKVRHDNAWANCFINENLFSISFSSTMRPRDYWNNKGTSEQQLFRFYPESSDYNKEYYFNLNPGENIDFYYDRIIESFKILSQHKW